MDGKTKTDRQFELLDERLIDIQGKLQNLKRDKGLETAVNKLASEIGGGLQAIALALSTPQDNSAEVQQRIDALASKMGLDATEQQDALDKFNQKTKEK